MDLLSKFSQLVTEVPQRTSSHLATIVSHALQPQDVKIPCPLDRNLEFFLTSHIDFLFIFGQCGDHCNLNLFLKRKVGVTECPRSLNSIKVIKQWPSALSLFILVLSARARCMTWHADLRVQ